MGIQNFEIQNNILVKWRYRDRPKKRQSCRFGDRLRKIKGVKHGI